MTFLAVLDLIIFRALEYGTYIERSGLPRLALFANVAAENRIHIGGPTSSPRPAIFARRVAARLWRSSRCLFLRLREVGLTVARDPSLTAASH